MIDYLLYVLFFIIFIILITYIYIKLKYGFWNYLPVFHTYNIKYKIWPIGVIEHNLPREDKYTNFKNIETIVYSEISDFKKNKFVEFIKDKCFKTENYHYLPNISNIIPYFKSHNKKSFISFYNEDILLADIKQGKSILDSCVIGLISSRPIRIILNNKDSDSSFQAYYIDYYCSENANKNENRNRAKKNENGSKKTSKNENDLFPQLVQTHYYNQCHINKKVEPCIFKLADNDFGVRNAISPLCKYLIYEFSVNKWTKPIELSSIYKLVEINIQNLHLLLDFIKINSHKFDILICSEPTNIMELIKTKQLFIYTIITNQEMICAYFFRKTCIFIEKNMEILSCFASIYSNEYERNVFIQGFKISFWKVAAENYFGHAIVENISDNNIIIDNLCVKTKSLSIRKMSYYFYNFAYNSFSPKKSFFLM